MNKIKNAKKCWKYWECPISVKKDCPVYTSDLGHACWMVSDYFKSDVCPGRKHKNCWECSWYKKMNS